LDGEDPGLRKRGAWLREQLVESRFLNLKLRVSMPADQLTKKELKEILDTILRQIDSDPDDGPRLRAAAAPLRIEFPDLKLVVNVRPDHGASTG